MEHGKFLLSPRQTEDVFCLHIFEKYRFMHTIYMKISLHSATNIAVVSNYLPKTTVLGYYGFTPTTATSATAAPGCECNNLNIVYIFFFKFAGHILTPLSTQSQAELGTQPALVHRHIKFMQLSYGKIAHLMTRVSSS